MIKNRFYGVLTVLLIAIEIGIIAGIHDAFIRPYVGDVLAVILLYAFIRSFFYGRVKHLPIMVLVMSIGVELLQLMHVGAWLGLRQGGILSLILGSTFDIMDILCYAVGVGLLVLGERWEFRSEYRSQGIKEQ